MSQPVVNQGFNSYITENSFAIAKAEKGKATLFYVAAVVSIVAILALTGVAIFASLGLIDPIPLFYIVPLVVGGVLSSIALTLSLKRAKASSAKALDAKECVDELIKLKEWQCNDVRKFFLKHRLSLINLPDDPLILAPAIARFHHLCNKTQKLFNDYKDAYFCNQPSLADEGRRIGLEILKNEALPTFLKAACVLEAIQNPKKPIAQLKLENFGSFNQDAERMIAASDFDSMRALLFS
jgi:hypothetical protein